MSALAVMEQRPPYVKFEERPVEDRNASIAAGRAIMKSEIWAIIHPLGSRDCIERNAEEWLADLDGKASRSQYNRDWVRAFHQMYEQFKSGQELTPNGTHVREWAVLSRAQAENLVSAGVLTVEDCAAMNEEAMRRVGMGARELKGRAKDWLTMADKRKGAEELNAVRTENGDLKTRIASLESKLEQLLAKQKGDSDG
jgi:hypothetical protein